MNFEDMRLGYENLWGSMNVARPDDAEEAAKGIIQDRARYENVEKATGVPWYFIGPVHHRESNRSFAGVLHNGERIIGTGKKTQLVPKGRGPFSSWDEAAIDAIKLQKLDNVGEWNIARILYEFERYNGFGYIRHKVNSPYVWAGTSLQQNGKYVADGQFDRNHWDKQLGTAAILKKLIELRPQIADDLGLTAHGESADQDVQSPFTTLKDYTTDQLVGELLSREHIHKVLIKYGKPEQ